MEKGDDSPVLGKRRRRKRNAAPAPTANQRRKKHREQIHLSIERPVELNFEKNIYKIYCKESQYHQEISQPLHRENLHPEHAQDSSNPQSNMASHLPKSNLIEGVVQSLITKGTNKETADTSKVSYLENLLKSQSYLEEYMYWQHGQAKSVNQKQYSKGKETNLPPQQMDNRSDEHLQPVPYTHDGPGTQSYLAEYANRNFNHSFENQHQNYFPQDQYNRTIDYSYFHEQRRLGNSQMSPDGPNYNITNEFSAPASIGHLNQNQHTPNMTVIRTTGKNPIDIQVNNYYKENTRNPASGQQSSKQDNTHYGSITFNTTAPNNSEPYADRQYAEIQNNVMNRPYIIATRRISSNRSPKKLPPKIVGRILEDPTTGIQYIEQFPNINNEGAPLQNNAYAQNLPVRENNSYNVPQHLQENQLPTNPTTNNSQIPNFGNYTASSINNQKPRNRRNICQSEPEPNIPNLVHSTAIPEHLNKNPFPPTVFNPIQENVHRPATMTFTPPPPYKLPQILKDLLPPLNVTPRDKFPLSLKEMLTPVQNTSNPTEDSRCSCQCLHANKLTVHNEHTHHPVVHNPHINKVEELVRRPTAQIGARTSLPSTATTTSTENRPFFIQSNNDQSSYIANDNKYREVAPIVIYSSDEETVSIPESDMKQYIENNHPKNNTDEGELEVVLPSQPQFANLKQDEHIMQSDPETFANKEVCIQNIFTKEEIAENVSENPKEDKRNRQLQEREEDETILKQQMTGLYKKITTSILKTDKLYKEVYDASAKFDEAYRTIQKRMCDYIEKTNLAIASTSIDASDKSNEEENNDSKECINEIIEIHDQKSNTDVIETYNDESNNEVVQANVDKIKTEITESYDDEYNTEVNESYDGESNVEVIKTYDDESNPGVIETNHEEKPNVLPLAHSIGDTKWTLKHSEASGNVVELVLNSGIFIDFSDLSRCKKDATDCETLAEMLLTSIFKEEALKNCSLTGDSSIDTNAKTSPGLDANGTLALITFVDEYANEVGWPEFKLMHVTSRLEKKIQDLKSDG